MKGIKILILGSSGYLGDELYKKLSAIEYFNVFGADILPSKKIPNERYFSINVLIKDDFNKLDDDFDFFINCTGQISGFSAKSYELNTNGIQNIIEHINKSRSKLIQISTLSVFGSSKTIIDEESNINPQTPYASFKSFAEFQIKNQIKDDRYLIIRLSNLYGNNQPKGLLAYLKKCYHNGEEIYINNNGDLKRYYLHIEDAIDIILKLIQSNKTGLFNAVGPDHLSIKQLIALFNNAYSYQAEVIYEKTKPWENVIEVNMSKLIKAINYNYKFNLDSFIKTKLK